MKVKIDDDVFEISKRIKEIDEDYFVVLNTKTNKFEVHNSSQVVDTFCLSLPFSCLDERSLFLVLKTKIENRENLILEIDRENEKLQKLKIQQIQNEINNQILKF